MGQSHTPHSTFHVFLSYNFFLILRKTPRVFFCKVSGSCARYRRGRVGESLAFLASLTSLHAADIEICRLFSR